MSAQSERLSPFADKFASVASAEDKQFFLNLWASITTYKEIANKILLSRLWPGDTLVDAGCGTGTDFGAFAKKVGATGGIVGLDLDPFMLAQAQKRIHGSNRL